MWFQPGLSLAARTSKPHLSCCSSDSDTAPVGGSCTLCSPQTSQEGSPACSSSSEPLLASPCPAHSSLHRQGGLGMPSEQADPAVQAEGAQLKPPAGQSWDTQLRFGQCPPVGHQGPAAIPQSKHSPCCKEEQEQGTALGIPATGTAQPLPA